MRPLLLALLLAQPALPPWTWRALPPLPRGLGGAHAGVLDGKLAVAGGSWWTAPPWSNGEKQFESAILTLEPGAAQWKRAGALPEGLAYGAAAALESALVIIGGQTAAGFSSKVWVLRANERGIHAGPATSLPSPLANAAAAVLNNRVYVFGGQSDPSGTSALQQMRSIALAGLLANRGQWREEPSLPGPARFFPQMASCGNRLYIAGGTDLAGQPPTRVFLRDAWTFTPAAGWKPIAPLPRPAQAGIGLCEAGQFYVLGGNDGSLSGREAELGGNHPGFSRQILRYDDARNAWRPAGHLPGSFVTTSAARWNNQWVITAGEDRPGHRTERVISGRIGVTKAR
jgi:N-acetylneuraminic acid mutarotase